MNSNIKPNGQTEPQAINTELTAHWWRLREHAIEIGIMAERELIRANALEPDKRRFYNRSEFRSLTQNT